MMQLFVCCEKAPAVVDSILSSGVCREQHLLPNGPEREAQDLLLPMPEIQLLGGAHSYRTCCCCTLRWRADRPARILNTTVCCFVSKACLTRTNSLLNSKGESGRNRDHPVPIAQDCTHTVGQLLPQDPAVFREHGVKIMQFVVSCKTFSLQTRCPYAPLLSRDSRFTLVIPFTNLFKV